MSKRFLISLVIIVVVMGLGVGAYFLYLNPETNSNTVANATNTTTNTQVNVSTNTPENPGIVKGAFATYRPVTVTVTPQVPEFTVEDDFSNVNNKDYFTDVSNVLNNQDFVSQLKKNYFVVIPSWYEEFYSAYEPNRYQYVPSFVTVDSMMHTYHLFFDSLLKDVEEQYLIPDLKTLLQDVGAKSMEQYITLRGTNWENAAKRNVAFFAVAQKLVDDSTTVPSIVQSEVNQELQYIADADAIHDAIVMNMGEDGGTKIMTSQGELAVGALKEDYSQYIPRGHYDRTEELKRYFKSMMWLGRMSFRIKSADETASAALMTQILSDTDVEAEWQAMYEPTSFFVGVSDDITYQDLKELLDNAYGASPSVIELAENTSAFDTFYKAAKKLEPPAINSIPIFSSSIEPDRDEAITAFRFMGQRFTVDASIFQRLICRDVGNKHGTMDCGGTIEDSRMLPNGLDIPAAMGSEEAYSLLDEQGETDYLKYPENMEALQEYVDGLDVSVWTQNLYWGWLFSLKPLVEPATEGYPQFMQNEAWVRKDLNTYLGSWSELKHDTILYAKQVYAELGAGMPEWVKYDDRGYVEPRPEIFARLAGLLAMTREGLTDCNMISDSMKENVSLLEDLSTQLKTIAEKELNNEARTDDEYELIRSYGGQLEHFWLAVNQDDIDASGMSAGDYLNENPASIIADVATDPNGTVLEVGTGHINTIYVLVEVEGIIKIAQGAVFSYYEFPWPLNDRLTDEKWRELLTSEDVPTVPDWTSIYSVKLY